jgi:hypothetical protein
VSFLRDFDPASMPRAYVRVVRAVTTTAAIALGTFAVYGFVAMGRTLNMHAADIDAILVLFKAGLLFLVSSVSAAMALAAGLVALRCWIA